MRYVLPLLLLLPACEDLKEKVTSSFQADPESFDFPKLAPGESAERRIEIYNRGAGDLLVGDITLRDDSSAGEFELFLEQDGDLVDPPETLTIAGGSDEPQTLVVRYSASDEAADTGRVLLRTNDADHLDVELPINTGGTGGEILINPRTVEFGEVEAGERGEREITISNIGLGELTVTELTLNGSEDFHIELAGERVSGRLDPSLVIASGDEVVVSAVYAPEVLGPDTAELVVSSTDPVEPESNVTLRANGAAPCINVIPGDLDFGSSLIVQDRDAATPNRRGLSIESCGTTPLRVTRIEIRGEDAFEVLDLPEVGDGEPLIELPAQSSLEDGTIVTPSEELAVGFWPLELRAYGATALIHSNAQAEPVEVNLFGRGVENACPIPDVVTDEFHVPPLEIITLDGTPSTDPGGEVRRYRWTVVSRPEGSVSMPVEAFENPRRPADGGTEDDEETPTALFFVDLAGEYEIELQVFDNLGQVSCDPVAAAHVKVIAVPEKDLHVQLVWSTPDDPDETDQTGTDVDLHFRHQDAGGEWGHSTFDCYFRNTNPDWGVQGDPTDNPSLDIDDTNGAGPENVNLEKPEVGATYDVGVVYFRAESTFGDREVDPRAEHLSLATVRIFARGDLLAEFVDRELTSVSQLWHVARVRWCEDFARCPEIELVDEVYEQEDWALGN